VQGVSEFLPISSSGHLAIFQHFFINFQEPGLLFDVMLHLATLVAVLIAFRKDIADMLCAFFSLFRTDGQQKDKEAPARRLILLLIFATFPVVAGVFLSDRIAALKENFIFVCTALMFTGVILLIADRFKPGNKTERSTLIRDAIFVGMAQILALIPGLSRSGTTITAGIVRGFDRSFAVKFSFLMSIPAILGAVVLELADAVKDSAAPEEFLIFIPGMLVAGISGYFSIRFLRRIAGKGRFGGFALYCLLMGAGLIVVNLIKARM